MTLHWKKALSALLLAGSLTVGVAAENTQASRLSLGYMYFGNEQGFIKQVDATNQALNRVAPTLFDLTADGELKLVADISSLTAEMKKRGIQVVPFLSNHWDRESGRKALANREKLTDQIAHAVVQYGLDGVNVDIENVTETDRDAYTDLVRLLRQKLPQGSELSVAIAANPNGWTKGWQGSYDVAGLSRYSDYLMLMAYDEHWNGQLEQGPVASISWVERSVQQALKSVSPDKLVLGIPLYGRYWSEDGRVLGAGIPNRAAEGIAARYGISSSWDTAAASPYFSFAVDGSGQGPVVNGTALAPGRYTVWYENEASIKAKLDLVHRYNLKGTGVWALSQESSDTWAYYGSWLNGQYYTDASGHWAEAEIREAAQKGWLNGTGSVSFSPEKPLSRAEAAAVLMRLTRSMGAVAAIGPVPGISVQSGSDPSGGVRSEGVSSGGAHGSSVTNSAPFIDVPVGYWGKADIEAAWSMGLTDGLGNGLFGPEQPVSREQFAAMAFRLRGLSTVAAVQPASFLDISAERWSWKAVSAMGAAGILQGYEDGRFLPERSISRAEAAVLLLRLNKQQ